LTELSEIRKVSTERIVTKTGEKLPEPKVTLDSPIGMFDSGLGGLSVLQILMKELPNEGVIYFADTARVPYGGRPPQEIVKINYEIIDYLIEQGIKLLVMACGTSSSIAYPVVKEKYKLPIVEIVTPGARAAVKATGTGRIGLIATVGTVDSGAFQREIKAIRADAEVFAQGCPLFVPLIEGGFIGAEETKRVAREYLKPILKEKIDTLILGCTHYPFLSKIIQEIAGPGVVLVNPGEEAVSEAKELLKKNDLLHSGKRSGSNTYLVSGSLSQFKEMGSRLMGKPLSGVHKVNLVAKKGPIR